MNLTNYTENNFIDWFMRAQSFSPPSTIYVGLIRATRGYSSSIRSTAVSVGDTVIPATPNGHIYRCTTAGTTGSGEPSWNTTADSTTNDGGTVVWTEMNSELESGSANVTEVSGGSYDRVSVASSLANWAGTQGAGTTTPSSGTGGTTSNNNAITFPAPSANWGVIWGFGFWSAGSSGNLYVWAALTTPKTVNSGDPAPSFAAAALTFQMDN